MSNGKVRKDARYPRDLAARIEQYADDRDISDSEALRRLARDGLSDDNEGKIDPIASALVQSAQMLLLASVVALCVAIPFGYPAQLVGVAGVMGIGAGAAGAGWAVRTGVLKSIGRARRQPLATDGGDRE